MGTASPPPAALVAGEPALAATAPLAPRRPAFFLAHGLLDPRRDRAGRRGRRPGDSPGDHVAELAPGSDCAQPEHGRGRAGDHFPAPRRLSGRGPAWYPALLAANGQPDRGCEQDREGRLLGPPVRDRPEELRSVARAFNAMSARLKT